MPARTVNRGPNPFAPVTAIENQLLSTPQNKYVDMSTRIQPLTTSPRIIAAIQNLRNRLKNNVYTQKHFGRLMEIDVSLIDFNVDIQRLVEEGHIAENIIELFDPRIMQPLNVIYIKETGRYSSWEGQQSGCAFALMLHFSLIASGTKIQCKVVDDDLTVPGSTLTGEAVGNYGFRRLGGNGRKAIGQYWTHRSRVNGVRLYGSTLREDIQSEMIQSVLEKNNMFPSASVQGQRKRPGMVTYIAGINNIACHGTQNNQDFSNGLANLDWALNWHDTYFPSEPGVDGGFILTFGRLAAEARDTGFTITNALEAELFRHVQHNYGTPKAFHDDCKARLKKWQKSQQLKESWSDSCLTPILLLDYKSLGGKLAVPKVNGMVTYVGI
ncbi:hypothetical protein UFOVP190_3 [uncultured Caudovirales phage]|uniref:Uncharacterized protein n=1 Tax=uncultured Caudovirales phage TaxID=2100421 RepID=A0A6J7WNA3_9CAUD|nr:hypothetical protein UFOVP190_3 [uncultured Caudovirales phage]